MRTVLFFLMSLLWIGCSTEPEPMVYGKDNCHFCKMTLIDQKFGAELVTATGKVYKFDDIICFMRYYDSGFEDPEKYVHKLVVDYAEPGKLIQAMDAFYLKSDEISSPMASHLAAFARQEDMNKLKKKSGGIYLVWGELVTQFK